MTTLGNFLDVPSFVLTSSVLVAGLLVGGRDIRRGLLASRDCLVPMGVIGMLIGAVKMLQSLSGDPSTLLVASGVALLPLIYALMLAPILGALAEFFPDREHDTSGRSFVRLVAALNFLFMVGLAALLFGNGSVIVFMDAAATVVVFLLLLVPSVISALASRSGWLTLWTALQRNSLSAAACAALLSCVGLLVDMNDPTAIGPWMALGLLGVLYCCDGLLVGILGHWAIAGKGRPNASLYTTSVAGIAVLISSFCLSLIFSLIS